MARENQFRDSWTTLDGRRMFARAAAGGPAEGPPAAPPVVLVHGLGVCGTYLMPTARLLAADHPTFVPDLPGHGRSAAPPRTLAVPQLADALAGWMRQHGLRAACLVANSLGCQTAIDLAVRFPELAGWLVLVGPTGDPAAPTAAATLARSAVGLCREPLSLWPILARDYLTTGPLRTLRELKLGLADPVREKLPRVAAPTLVVRGAADVFAPWRWVEEMADLLPRGEAREIPGAAHAVNFSAPGPLAAAVRRWVAAHPPARTADPLQAVGA